MKKLITIILVLALAVPTVVSAESLAGCWVFWLPNSASFGTGNFSVVLMLNENGEMALTYCTPKEDGLHVESAAGIWSEQNNGINIGVKGSETMFLEYSNNKIWLKVGSMNVGMKRMEYTADQFVYTQE